ncbi:MAG: hypothetical protein WCI55_12100 [Armatimonadota bacterium]
MSLASHLKNKVLFGKAQEATVALEVLRREFDVVELDFLLAAYSRRRKTIDRIEVIEMLGDVQSEASINALKNIVLTSSVPLVRYYAFRNLIESGISINQFVSRRSNSSFWLSLEAYERYIRGKITKDQLKKAAGAFAIDGDFNWVWLAEI